MVAKNDIKLVDILAVIKTIVLYDKFYFSGYVQFRYTWIPECQCKNTLLDPNQPGRKNEIKLK